MMKVISKRRLRRDAKARRHKRWIAIYDELQKLRNVIWKTPVIPLDEPYQRGWERFFVLDDELRERIDFASIQHAFELINRTQYCRTGKFTKRDAKTKRIRKRVLELKFVNTRSIYTRELIETDLRYFLVRSGKPIGDFARLRELRGDGYVLPLTFRYANFCHPVVEPYMITHRRPVLPEVEARISELESIIEREQIWKRLYGNYRYWNIDERWKNLERALDEDMEAETQRWELEKGTADTVPFFVLITWCPHWGNCGGYKETSDPRILLIFRIWMAGKHGFTAAAKALILLPSNSLNSIN